MNTPKGRQQWILDLLKNKPTLSYGDCFSKYSVNFSKTERTFNEDWKIVKQQLKEYQDKVQKEKERVSISEEIKTVKRGLKTKIERLLNYQKLVDDCLKDLTEGMTNDITFKDGKPLEFRRKMTTNEYNQTRRTLKDLQSEISKIEGDYAPNKQEVDVLTTERRIIMPDGTTLEDYDKRFNL